MNRTLLVKIDKPAGGPSRLSSSEPIGTCYIAAYLRENGQDCRLAHIVDAAPAARLRQEIEDYEPTIVGFSVRNFNLELTRSCIVMMREEFPEIRIVIGGECITEDLFERLGQILDADLMVMGDGEVPMLRYCQGAPPETIPSVAFRTAPSTFARSGIPAPPSDIAKLPMMLRDGLPMGSYRSEAFPGLRYATMHTQRGCRYRCSFCHTAGRYPSLLRRTVAQVLEEVDYLVREHAIEAIGIWDEDLFADAERMRRIAQGLIDRGSPIQWHGFMKLTDLRRPEIRKLLPTLRDSGFVRAVVGLESFDPESLKSYRKAHGGDVVDLAGLLTNSDIVLCPTYIIGAPHETEEDVRTGLDRLLALRDEHGMAVDLPYVSFIMPYPGTALFHDYEKNGLILDTDWSHYDGHAPVVKSRCSPARLLELRDEFYEAIYGPINSPARSQLSAGY